MTSLLHWFTSAEWAQIVKALLHSLWQSAVIALLLAVVLRRASNPAVRYRLSLIALATIVFATIVTWSVINASEHRPLPTIQTNAQAPEQTSGVVPVPAQPNSQTVGLATRENSNIQWTAWLAFAWLVGAVLMLARAGIKVAGAESLRRSCRPLDNSQIESLLAETRHALGLAKQIRVGITNKLTSPAVVGVLVPMLILPLGLLTALTPEQIRFILLHELAHIRRRDYLANLFQFFAESLLFFNPAVWWISHQIRREREACCDALAIELSGAPADYARALVHVAEKVLYPAPAAAPAFGNRRELSLTERIQRLLVPGYRPSLRLTWRAMLAALTLGSILLFLSAIGTRMTVAAILTPQQRIAVIEKKMAEYGQTPEGVAQTNRAPLALTALVRTADDSPLPRKRLAAIYQQFGNSSSVASWDIKKDGAISDKTVTPGGELWVAAYVDGFAPAVAGPIDTSDSNRLDLGEMVLNRGFDVTIRITDAVSGKALPNAAVHTQFWMRGIGSTIQEPGDLKTDSNGEATLHHCADQPLSIFVNAPGHELIDQRFENVHPGETLNLELQTGGVLAGIVTDKNTGQPIAGATVRMIYRKGPTTGHYEWNDPMRLLATTGDDGRFVANQLQPATLYWLGVSAPGHESVLLGDQAAGQQDLRIPLGPTLIVRGEVRGDVKGFSRIDNNYALYLAYSEVFDGSSYGDRDWVHLNDVDGVMRFEFTNRVAGPISLNAPDGRSFTRDVQAPVDNWIIDLNVPTNNPSANLPKREVVFRFKDPSGTPPIGGTVSVSVPDNLDPKHLTAHTETIAITNGEVHVSIAIGGSTSIQPDHMIGYWFSEFGPYNNSSLIEVTNGLGPMIIDVPVIPAGAIYAKARNADGTRAGGLLFRVQELKRAPGRADNMPLSNGDSVSGEAPRKWVSGPLPLRGTYRITGSRGNSFCVSKPITLTGENPTADVELQFPPGTSIEGILQDANGRPIPNAELKPVFTLPKDNEFGLNSIFTDENGRFRMDNLTPSVGDYTVEAHASGMMAERVQLGINGQPQTIRLKPGRRIAGTVVEAGTGNVLPGAEIRIVDLEHFKVAPSLTTHTDAEGRFEFTELGTGNYTPFVDGGQQTGPQRTYRGDKDTNITLAVKLYPWSNLKPKPLASIN